MLKNASFLHSDWFPDLIFRVTKDLSCRTWSDWSLVWIDKIFLLILILILVSPPYLIRYHISRNMGHFGFTMMIITWRVPLRHRVHALAFVIDLNWRLMTLYKGIFKWLIILVLALNWLIIVLLHCQVMSHFSVWIYIWGLVLRTNLVSILLSVVSCSLSRRILINLVLWYRKGALSIFLLHVHGTFRGCLMIIIKFNNPILQKFCFLSYPFR